MVGIVTKSIAEERVDKLDIDIDIQWGRLTSLDRDQIRQLDAWIDIYNHRVDPDKSISSSSVLSLLVLEEIVDLMVAETYTDLSPSVQSSLDDLSADLSSLIPHIENPSTEDMITVTILDTLLDKSEPLSRIQPLTYSAELQRHDNVDDVRDRLNRLLPSDAPLQSILLSAINEHPDSLEDQFSTILEQWDAGKTLEPVILRTIDLIREQTKFRGGGHGAVLLPEYDDTSPEAYSEDKDWMPQVVLLAKHTKVWLHQLSNKYDKTIMRLDQIPAAELEEISDQGFTGLWLIGIWERSTASEKIKHRMGNPDATASAYALWDYVIADDLGGHDAYQVLVDRASQVDLKIACDMVPNHTGILSKWVIEHPDWYIQTREVPFPSYTFQSEDLSDHPYVNIYLEDHYYSHADAAVVFKRVDIQNDDIRYIYHGNDGTSIPWNDTAQLDFIKSEVREAVIDTIVRVAKMFPIIRLDAAMVLTKKHFQRLWYPIPGTGGDIPSRSRFGMSRAEFEVMFPVEFWREVVDRIELEAPNTLLVAEAFWMLEGYFVRTLGVHRVYNSAFMHMLRDQKNEEYRNLIKSTLEYGPRILERYVNFMSNPDEETAIEQFDSADKYFGVAVMMVTLPGLPMFAHGQIEGYTEKYGMEFQQPQWDEAPDQEFIALHERLIFPLLAKRYVFARAKSFRLYDFRVPDGHVNEDVYALSNRSTDEFILVLYNNSIEQTTGWINTTLPFNAKLLGLAESESYQSTLVAEIEETSELASPVYCVFSGLNSDLCYIRKIDELRDDGLYIELNGYQHQIFNEFKLYRDEVGLAEIYDDTDGSPFERNKLPVDY